MEGKKDSQINKYVVLSHKCLHQISTKNKISHIRSVE